METLLNQLKLTGISSSAEFVGYNNAKVQQHKVVNNFEILIDKNTEIKIDESDQYDSDDYITRRILEGECG